MDTNTSKRKCNHEEDSRLSDLPDDILVIILSFLKTKEAVRAGILSTRWKNIWSYAHNLDLSHSDFKFKSEEDDNDAHKVEARLSEFLDRVLIACKESSFEKINIQGRNCDPRRLVLWLRAALERNVSELHVNFSGISDDPPCELLSHNLFAINNLVDLKLCVDMTLSFQTANSSCFPNLKVVELVNIFYKDDDSIRNLLSCCPVLEELVIVKPRWDDLRTLDITSSSLKRLKVNACGEEYEELDDVKKMVIDAPALMFFDVSCSAINDIMVKDLSSIMEAELDMFDSTCMSNCYKFLRCISNVKFLTLEVCTVQALMITDSDNLPTFHNLTHLTMYGADDPDIYGRTLLQWRLMLEILQKSPLLENLKYRDFLAQVKNAMKCPIGMCRIVWCRA